MGEDNTPTHLHNFSTTFPNWGRRHHSVFFLQIITSVQSKGVTENIYDRPKYVRNKEIAYEL